MSGLAYSPFVCSFVFVFAFSSCYHVMVMRWLLHHQPPLPPGEKESKKDVSAFYHEAKNFPETFPRRLSRIYHWTELCPMTVTSGKIAREKWLQMGIEVANQQLVGQSSVADISN